MNCPEAFGQTPSNSSPTAELSTPAKLADKYFDDYYQQYLILFPLEATAIGDNRYNNLLPARISEDFIAREKSLYQKTLSNLDLVDSAKLDESRALAKEILVYELKIRLDGLKYRGERIPASQATRPRLLF